MTATIELLDERRFVNLLHALYGMSDIFSHDADKITFRREDAVTLFIDFAVHFVSYGLEGAPDRRTVRSEGDRLWAANVGIGELHDLLLMFIRRRDDEIRKLALWDPGVGP